MIPIGGREISDTVTVKPGLCAREHLAGLALACALPRLRGYPGRASVAATIQDLVLGRYDRPESHTTGLPADMVRRS
jgi:hypothetical protein